MRILSEFTPYEKVAAAVDTIKDYGFDLCVAVTPKKLKSFGELLKILYKKDIATTVWPLLGGPIQLLYNGYFINTHTVDRAVKFLTELNPFLKFSNIKTVTLDMESLPGSFGYFSNVDRSARQKLESAVEVVQNDFQVTIETMEWYYSKGLDWFFQSPVPRNARMHTYMVYPPMGHTRFAPIETRKNFFAHAIHDGKEKYGEINLELRNTDLGVWGFLKFMLLDWPFKPLVYTEPEELKRDISLVKKLGGNPRGIYSLDGMLNKLDWWLKGLMD